MSDGYRHIPTAIVEDHPDWRYLLDGGPVRPATEDEQARYEMLRAADPDADPVLPAAGAPAEPDLPAPNAPTHIRDDRGGEPVEAGSLPGPVNGLGPGGTGLPEPTLAGEADDAAQQDATDALARWAPGVSLPEPAEAEPCGTETEPGAEA
jgi:hypothetical protein